jgi:hypothetical protein
MEKFDPSNIQINKKELQLTNNNNNHNLRLFINTKKWIEPSDSILKSIHIWLILLKKFENAISKYLNKDIMLNSIFTERNQLIENLKCIEEKNYFIENFIEKNSNKHDFVSKNLSEDKK